MKKELNFYRTLWIVKVNFQLKKLDPVALSYLFIQEIDPWKLSFCGRVAAQWYL
jgi:hypothetical protein